MITRALNRSRGKKAQTTVEFSLILPYFLMILLGILDFAQLFFYTFSLQHAVREAGRFATTGQLYGGAEDRTTSIKLKLRDNCLLPIPLDNIAIKSWPGQFGAATAENPNMNAGIQQDTVRIEAYYYVGMVTPLYNFLPAYSITDEGKYIASAFANFRNEPSKNFATNPVL